jgi:hypothetical protein
MVRSSGPDAVDMVPEKPCDFSTYLAKSARAQSGACAEVQFPDYCTELWSGAVENVLGKHFNFLHLSCQESEKSFWRMRRGEVS